MQGGSCEIVEMVQAASLQDSWFGTWRSHKDLPGEMFCKGLCPIGIKKDRGHPGLAPHNLDAKALPVPLCLGDRAQPSPLANPAGNLGWTVNPPSHRPFLETANCWRSVYPQSGFSFLTGCFLLFSKAQTSQLRPCHYIQLIAVYRNLHRKKQASCGWMYHFNNSQRSLNQNSGH